MLDEPNTSMQSLHQLSEISDAVDNCRDSINTKASYYQALDDLYREIVTVLDKPWKQELGIGRAAIGKMGLQDGEQPTGNVEDQWRNFRDCPKCGAIKGSACRMINCAQLDYAPLAQRYKTVDIEKLKHELMVKAKITTTFSFSRDELIDLLAQFSGRSKLETLMPKDE